MSAPTDRRATVEQARAAAEAAAELAGFLAGTQAVDAKIRLGVGDADRMLVLPRTALERLVEVLEGLGQGRAVSVVPFEREISTQEAADLLGVSRPYVVKLLEEGRMPFRRVGNRRRVALGEVLAYKRTDDAERREALRREVAADPDGSD